MLHKINIIIFIILILVFGITFFTRNSYKGNNEFDPATLKDPIRKNITSQEAINFGVDHDLSVALTPIADYEVSGLLVNKTGQKYVMVWGNNLAVGAHKTIDASESHVTYHSEKANFDTKQSGSFTIYTNSNEVKDKLNSVRVGDQIRLVGQIITDDVSNKSKEEGFCKAFYLKDVEILKSGNPVSRFLFITSFVGLIIFIILNIAGSIYTAKNRMNNSRS